MIADRSVSDLIAAAGSKPVLTLFGTPSCGPTLAMMPVLDEFDEATEKAFVILTINIESEPDVARSYNIRATPTFILLRDKEILGTMAGTMSSEQMISWAASALAPKVEKSARGRKE